MLNEAAKPAASSTPAHEVYERTGHFPALDGLRGLAVLMVMAYHCPRLVLPGIEQVQKAGDTGVDVFFVLSGFLITMLLLRDRSGTEASTTSLLGHFYLKRVLRIFPLYYVAIGLYWLKVQVSPDPLAAGLYNDYLPYLGTYTIDAALGWGDGGFPAFGIAWSLGVEEKFYLLWPLFVLLLKPRHVLYAGLAVIGVTLLWRAWLVQTYVGPLAARLYYPFDVRMDGIMWGCVVACVLHDRRTFGAAACLLRRSFAPLFGAGIFAAAAIALSNDSFWRYLLPPLGAALVIGAAVVRLDQPMLRPLGTRPMRYVGRISYGMYVLHPLAFSCATILIGEQTLAQRAVYMAAGTGLSIVVAAASYRWFESPILRLRHRRASRLRTEPGRGSHVAITG
jgi:peptidoglycan/LPS O-acetylase OafA/YrhL